MCDKNAVSQRGDWWNLSVGTVSIQGLQRSHELTIAIPAMEQSRMIPLRKAR